MARAWRFPDLMKSADNNSDFELAVRAARLWPNREHEASSVCGLLCRLGLHRWRRLDLSQIAPGRNIRHCFWCSKVRIDGTIYDV